MDSAPSELAIASVRFRLEEVEEVAKGQDERRWISAFDDAHPILAGLPPLESFPTDTSWRLAARFDAFASPRVVRVPDVRGGVIDLQAVGTLVFRRGGEEHRLTAIAMPSGREFLVMFRDSTTGVTTYGGYRSVYPRVPDGDGWTVLDFNKAANPPCAYSGFTTCPTAPRENRLALAVTAGEKAYSHVLRALLPTKPLKSGPPG
jgi:uncharacterized protein (DUF1684 family)